MRKVLWITIFLLFIVNLSVDDNLSAAGGFPAKEIYEQTSNDVVLIIAKAKKGPDSVGAGSIISNDGLIITNNHVVFDEKSSLPCSQIKVYLRPSKVTGKFETDLVNGYQAKILHSSQELDLAVLKIKGPPCQFKENRDG